MGDEPVSNAVSFVRVHEVTKPGSEVKTNVTLKLEEACSDLKINLLHSAIQFNGEKCESSLVLTKTDFKARIIEYPADRTLQQIKQYVHITSIHNYMTEHKKKKVLQKFVEHKIKILVLSYTNLEYFIQMYKKIEVDKVYVFDLPQHDAHYNLLHSSTSLIIKDGLSVLFDPQCENHRRYTKTWIYYLEKNELQIPDCLLNAAKKRRN